MIWLKAIVIVVGVWTCLIALGFGLWHLLNWGHAHIGWWFPGSVFFVAGFIASVLFAVSAE